MLVRTSAAALRVRVLGGFDDPSLPELWDALPRQENSDLVFLTWPWQSTWWEVFGRGRLLLVLAERGGRALALAPLFHDGGMIFFVGSGGSDYLDFIGRTDPDVVAALLDAARALVPDFLGFRLYHLPRASPSAAHLYAAARRLGLDCLDEGSLGAPLLDLARDPAAGLAAADKQSLRRHERALRRAGALEVEHLHDGEAIRPHLEAFFAQHIARWRDTASPSLFLDPQQVRFYRRLVERAGRTGWLRFTRVDWCGSPVAFHFGFCYRGAYLWYKPSFAPEHARSSPGEVLLRQLLLAAVGEGAHTFDFGLGEEPFKQRFASHVRRVDTLGLYPPAQVAEGRRA